jgi:hypothetical protein
MDKRSTRPGMNWKTTINAANPRKRISKKELPLPAEPFTANAGDTIPSVAAMEMIRLFMVSSLAEPANNFYEISNCTSYAINSAGGVIMFNLS